MIWRWLPDSSRHMTPTTPSLGSTLKRRRWHSAGAQASRCHRLLCSQHRQPLGPNSRESSCSPTPARSTAYTRVCISPVRWRSPPQPATACTLLRAGYYSWCSVHSVTCCSPTIVLNIFFRIFSKQSPKKSYLVCVCHLSWSVGRSNCRMRARLVVVSFAGLRLFCIREKGGFCKEIRGRCTPWNWPQIVI
jgi:hypothetical protein